MTCTYNGVKSIALSLALAGGILAFGGAASAQTSNDRTAVHNAKQQLPRQANSHQSADENSAGRGRNAAPENTTAQVRNSAGRSSANYEATDTNTVQAAQQQLTRQSMYSGAVDGVMGPKTASAIRYYQRQNGLKVTRRLDRETLSSLGVTRQ